MNLLLSQRAKFVVFLMELANTFPLFMENLKTATTENAVSRSRPLLPENFDCSSWPAAVADS